MLVQMDIQLGLEIQDYRSCLVDKIPLKPLACYLQSVYSRLHLYLNKNGLASFRMCLFLLLTYISIIESLLSLQVVKQLLDAGADASAVTDQKRSALLYASSKNNHEILLLLLAARYVQLSMISSVVCVMLPVRIDLLTFYFSIYQVVMIIKAAPYSMLLARIHIQPSSSCQQSVVFDNQLSTLGSLSCQ